MHKMGRFADVDPEEQKRLEEEFSQEAAGIKLGDRCLLQSEDGLDKKGTVMYVGKTDFKQGYWVGIKYDEPLGKHDGTYAISTY
jgi:tubulin-folding cofactor B